MTLKIKPVLCLLGIPIAFFGALQLIFSLASETIFNDGAAMLFLESGSACLIGGGLLFITLRRYLREFIFREAFLLVALTWMTLGLVASVPFVVFENLSFADAVFEAISGLTTTGATMITGLDREPHSVLLYRQALQWIGGLGVIVLMIAIIPMLNVGGMQVFKAETPGPFKDEKLTPRIYKTAQSLYLVYILITLACMVSYHLAGMSWYDAFAHSLSTISTGGFSTHDASLGYYDSVAIEAVADLFMLLSAMSFGLHYLVLRSKDLNIYWNDEETRWFLLVISGASLIMAGYLYSTGVYGNWMESFRYAAFTVISFMSSTGFGATDVPNWPEAAMMFLILLSYFGGCAGSTAGGSKMVRICISFRSALLDMKYLLHPNGVFSLKYNRRPIDGSVTDAVSAFFLFNVALSSALIVTLMSTGLPFLTSVSAVAACLNVLGPAFGELGANYQPINEFATWVLSLAMILGRLDLFTVIVILFPAYWRG